MSRSRARPSQRSGFTLTEMLIALAVFSVISAAMIGIMATSIDLYRTGEFARAANEEAMAVFGLIERDLARAVPPTNGGHFYARVLDGSGNCAIGWTVRNLELDSDTTTRFVLYSATGDKLQRKEVRDIEVTGATSPGGQTITGGCLHFGAWLVGTSHKISDDLVERSRQPTADSHWSRVEVPQATGDFLTEPFMPLAHSQPENAGPAYDTRKHHSDRRKTPLAYPHTVRFTVLLTGSITHAPVARLLESSLPGQQGNATFAQTSEKSEWRIAGSSSVPNLPGSIARIGNELIGFHAYQNNRLQLNTDASHGPLFRPATGGKNFIGRAVLRSRGEPHAQGDMIRFGRFYSLVKGFPW